MFKIVKKRNCSLSESKKNPQKECFRVYSPESKRHFSKKYMTLEKANRQLSYLNQYISNKKK